MPAVSALSRIRQDCSSIASTERPSEKSSPCRRLMYAGRPRAASPSPKSGDDGPPLPEAPGLHRDDRARGPTGVVMQLRFVTLVTFMQLGRGVLGLPSAIVRHGELLGQRPPGLLAWGTV